MPEIIHSTKVELDGPWLIPRERLLELDQLLDAEWKKLVKHHDLTIEKEVDEELNEITGRLSKEEQSDFDKKAVRKQLGERYSDRYAYKRKRQLVIHLDGDRRVAASCFEEALRDPALLNEKPKGFTVNLRAADIECSLGVPSYSHYLELKVTPDRDATAKGLFAALNLWVSSVRPPFWQTVWLRLKGTGGPWFLWFIILSALFLYISTFAPDISAASRTARHSEAVAVLNASVSATNQFKAIELILSYESGAIPNSRTFAIPSWFWWFLCGGPVICTFLGFAPKVVIGIGRGEEAIGKWNSWMRLVGITLPLWIAGTFVWPKIQAWLSNIF